MMPKRPSCFYRVFKKKGNKVLYYYKTKKYISGAEQGLILTTSIIDILTFDYLDQGY